MDEPYDALPDDPEEQDADALVWAAVTDPSATDHERTAYVLLYHCLPKVLDPQHGYWTPPRPEWGAPASLHWDRLQDAVDAQRSWLDGEARSVLRIALALVNEDIHGAASLWDFPAIRSEVARRVVCDRLFARETDWEAVLPV